MITTGLVVGAAAIAVYTDVRRRKIPNWLVAALLVCGLAVRGFGGISAVGTSLIIFVIVLVLGAVAFAAGVTGGGDVKFMAAAGAVLGWPHAFAFLTYTLVAGGMLAIGTALVRGRMRTVFANVRFASYAMLSGARPGDAVASGGSIPYAVAIFAGATALALGDLFALTPRILS